MRAPPHPARSLAASRDGDWTSLRWSSRSPVAVDPLRARKAASTPHVDRLGGDELPPVARRNRSYRRVSCQPEVAKLRVIKVPATLGELFPYQTGHSPPNAADLVLTESANS